MSPRLTRIASFFSTRLWVVVLGVAFVVMGIALQHGEGPASGYIKPLLATAGLGAIVLGWRPSPRSYAVSGSLVAAGCLARLIDLAFFTVEHWERSWRSGLYGMVSWVALGVACMLGWRGAIASMVGERS